jgi:DNA-directed RNA polymerase subunit M/transcription elongation factor TFIIS
MDQPVTSRRTCPECGSTEYLFWGRKQIAAAAQQQAAVETTHRCKVCGHQWKVREAMEAAE